MINIQPDDYHEAPRKLELAFKDTDRLRSLQQGVSQYQRRFLWDADSLDGVFTNLDQELVHRAAFLFDPLSLFS
jgi:hypothetical protein